MKTKYKDFNESKKSKKSKTYCICKKTYEKWLGEEHGPMFIEGEKYTCSERLETISGDYVIIVDSHIKFDYDHEVKYKFEKFYADEYNDEEVKKWEEIMSKVIDTPFYKENETSHIFQKPRNNPYFGDYFEII